MATDPFDNQVAGPADAPDASTPASTAGGDASFAAGPAAEDIFEGASLPQREVSEREAPTRAAPQAEIEEDAEEEEPAPYQAQSLEFDEEETEEAAATSDLSYEELMHQNNLGRDAALGSPRQGNEDDAETGSGADEDPDQPANDDEETADDQDDREVDSPVPEGMRDNAAYRGAVALSGSEEQLTEDLQTATAFASGNLLKGAEGVAKRGFVKTAMQIGALAFLINCLGCSVMVISAALVAILVYQGVSSAL